MYTRLKYQEHIFVPMYCHAFTALSEQLNVGAILYFCSSAFHYFLAHMLKAKSTGHEATLSTYSRTPAVKFYTCIVSALVTT